jgi:hypothetical protein
VAPRRANNAPEQIAERIVKILRKHSGGISLASSCHILAFLMDEGVMGRLARLRDVDAVHSALQHTIRQGKVLCSPDGTAIGLPPGNPPVPEYRPLLDIGDDPFDNPARFRHLPSHVVRALASY